MFAYDIQAENGPQEPGFLESPDMIFENGDAADDYILFAQE